MGDTHTQPTNEDQATGVTRVAIYGSCTSRDTVPAWDPSLELAAYVARQSVISAVHPCNLGPAHLEAILDAVPAGWRRSQQAGDLAGSAPVILTDTRPDLIVWDLTDERTGVARLAGGWYTRNKWLHPDGDTIAFGTDEHFHLWVDSLEQMAAILDEARLLHRVVINATRWAPTDTSGRLIYEAEARRWETLAKRYYTEFDRYCIPLLRAHPPIADPDSPWGPAPFHLDHASHTRFAAALTEFITH